MEFRWIPHQGIDLAAVERMKQHFSKPDKAPREDWFMSEVQEYHTELLKMPSREVETQYLTRYLETASGIKNFGRWDEWVVWFRYLLPFVLLRIQEGELHAVYGMDLLTLLIDYCLNLYPDKISEEYPGFRNDVMSTIPQCLMETQFWDKEDLAKQLPLYNERTNHWCSSPLHATLFFTLKYLTVEEIPSWMASIAIMEGQFWRQQIVQWLNSASRFFWYIEHPEKLPQIKSRRGDSVEMDGSVDEFLEGAGINWDNSYCVFSGVYSSKNLYDYLPKENIDTFWNEVKKYPQLAFHDANGM